MIVTRLSCSVRGTGTRAAPAGEEILDAYVELGLSGEDPGRSYPGTAIHLESCPGCRADYEGLLEAARSFSDTAGVTGPREELRAER
jgi:hypothetical protein